MDILRSRDVHLLKFAISKDECYDLMFDLSKLQQLEIVDLNSNETAANQTFSQEVK